MTYSRVDELTKARNILVALGLNSTSRIVANMEVEVNSRKTIDWSEIQRFLDTFEKESGNASRHGQTCKETFVIMEKIIMQALEDCGVAKRKELKRRALSAPKIDKHIDSLEYGLSILHNEAKKATRMRTFMSLLMFGHAVRWQALEDFAKVWVGHWGKGISNQNLKKDAVEMVLTIRSALQTSSGLIADSRLYRSAIAHGGFKFVGAQDVSFWTRDRRGKSHDLPPLNSGDLLNLYNMTEVRLRTMEAFARVLRTWGRHG